MHHNLESQCRTRISGYCESSQACWPAGGLASSTAEIALLNKFVKRYSSSLCASQAATFVSNFLRALSSSRLMKTAQAVMLEAAQEVAAEVATTIQEAGQAWSEGVVAHLRSIVRTAATLGSRERQHQVYQSKTVSNKLRQQPQLYCIVISSNALCCGLLCKDHTAEDMCSIFAALSRAHRLCAASKFAF